MPLSVNTGVSVVEHMVHNFSSLHSHFPPFQFLLICRGQDAEGWCEAELPVETAATPDGSYEELKKKSEA